MRRRAILSLVLCSAIFALIGGVADVYAVATTTPTQYSVTFLKFELKKQDGTYVSVWSGSATVDLVKLASGNFADMAVLENLNVSPGTYTAFRMSIDKTIKVACDNGTVETDGGDLSAGPGLGSVPTGVLGTGDPVAPGNLVIPDAQLTGGVYLFEQAFAGSVTVADGDVMGDFEVTIDITDTFIPVDVSGMGDWTFQPSGGDPSPDVTVTLPAGY